MHTPDNATRLCVFARGYQQPIASMVVKLGNPGIEQSATSAPSPASATVSDAQSVILFAEFQPENSPMSQWDFVRCSFRSERGVIVFECSCRAQMAPKAIRLVIRMLGQRASAGLSIRPWANSWHRKWHRRSLRSSAGAQFPVPTLGHQKV